MNKGILISVALALTVAGCDAQESSTQIERKKQEELSLQAITQVGMPAITNFAEKRMLKDIIELRDKMQPTYTYLAGEQQGVIGEKICDSLGYGISAATQYTNPQKIASSAQGGFAILPQADPNGLFSPASTEGTWVMCKVPGSDKIAPQYIEPRVIVLTFPKETRK
jgi:hypothetical protein